MPKFDVPHGWQQTGKKQQDCADDDESDVPAGLDKRGDRKGRSSQDPHE
jgi:uncharacterized protein YbdZ (MbtH family)